MFQVTEESELQALLKALLAAKFHPDPESLEIPGSPSVARLCERAVEALVNWQKDHGQGDRAQRTRNWFYIATHDHPLLKLVRMRIAQCRRVKGNMWQGWSGEQRSNFVRTLLSPYICAEGLICQLAANDGDAPANEQVAPSTPPPPIESDEFWKELIQARFPDWGTGAAITRWTMNRPPISLGQVVCGDVLARAPFGIWLDIGVGHPVLYLLPDLIKDRGGRQGFQFPAMGEQITGRVVALGDRAVITISGGSDALGNYDQTSES